MCCVYLFPGARGELSFYSLFSFSYPSARYADAEGSLTQPQGRSFAELDLLFEKGISARKFASTRVDVFDVDHGHGHDGEKSEVESENDTEKVGEKGMAEDQGREVGSAHVEADIR